MGAVSDPLPHVISRIYDAALAPDLWPAALQAVMGAAGAVGAGYCVWHKQTRRVELLQLSGVLADTQADYVDYYAALDPYCPLLEAAPRGRLLRLSKCLKATLRHNEWYNDYLLKAGINDCIGTRLFDSKSHSVLFGIDYGIDQRSFTATGVEALQKLLGPLGKAAQLNVELLGLELKSAIALGALDQLAAGVIITDGNRRVLELNRVAEHIVQRGDGLNIRDGQLGARRVFEATKLAQLITAAAAEEIGTTAGCMLVGRCGGRAAYILTVAPLSANLAFLQRPLAMILVSDPDEPAPSGMDLAEFFGLSPAESQLAATLMTGKTLREIAEESGVQITTLRTQLRSVFRKVGVDRQADLIRILTNTRLIGSHRF